MRRCAFPLRWAIPFLVFVSCGQDDTRSTPARTPASSDVARAVQRAAEAVWKTIDDYDAKAFAALSVDPKDKTRPLDAKEVESFVMDLHQKYGVRGHRFVPGPAPAAPGDSAVVYVVIGDREEALALTFASVAGAWKLASVSNADAQTVLPDVK